MARSRIFAHKSRRGPLSPAHGAGSINAEADMLQLLHAGKPTAAAALYEAHHRIRGVRPMHRMSLWYELWLARSNRVQLTDLPT